MKSVRESFEANFLCKVGVLNRIAAAVDVFGDLLKGVSPEWIPVLSYFAEVRPLKYWNPMAVTECLRILETDAGRSVDSIIQRAANLEIAYANIFRVHESSSNEEILNISDTEDLIQLSSVFHPEYVRVIEHIYSNIISVIWGIRRKGGVSGKFVPKNAVAELNSSGLEFLSIGFNERIRNAVAHGQVSFRGDGIQYGFEQANYRLPSMDFLREFDDLRRTSNSIALAILIFIGRNAEELRGKFKIPISLLSKVVASLCDGSGSKVGEMVESDFKLVGKQLHIQVDTSRKAQGSQILDGVRIAMKLVGLGVVNYNRFIFQFNCGATVKPMLAIFPEKLLVLLRENASEDRISEIFDKNAMLMWTDENRFFNRLRATTSIWSEHMLAGKKNFERKRNESGLSTSLKYEIREKLNKSVEDIYRLELRIVLRNCSDSQKRETLKSIISSVVSQYKYRPLRAKKSSFNRFEFRLGGLPNYIWISLYQVDGTLRWLRGGGWASGNLLAQAEYISSEKYDSISVKRPEEIFEGIRIRYSIDQIESEKVEDRIQNFLKTLNDNVE